MKTSKLSLQDLATDAQNSMALFVCSASFEERSIAVSSALRHAYRCLIAYNEDYYRVLSDNLSVLKRFFPGATMCKMSAEDPVQTTDAIVHGIDSVWPTAIDQDVVHIGVDITTFTRESLLILMKYIWSKMSPKHKLVLYYNQAREYAIGATDAEKWLSRGIREVRSVLGYPGRLLPSRENHLIVLTGFEDRRALALVTECDPYRLSLGVTDAADRDTARHQAVNEERRRLIQNQFGPARYFSFGGYDPAKAERGILEEIGKCGPTNTILAPMNTKLSTVGAALVGCRCPDVQLCYAQAEVYNIVQYSAPSEYVYVVSLEERDWSVAGKKIRS